MGIKLVYTLENIPLLVNNIEIVSVKVFEPYISYTIQFTSGVIYDFDKKNAKKLVDKKKLNDLDDAQ